MARDPSSRPEAKPLRLFVAIDVPKDIKETLETAIAPFRDRIPGARWTAWSGWHLTVKFLGWTWPRLVEWVQGRVREAATSAEPFESRLGALGVFPSPGRARVLWAGLEDPGHRFQTIAATLAASLEEHFPPEARGFTPHLTVARLAPPRNLREFAPDLLGTTVASPSFRVDCLTLYRSHLSPRGARYESLLEARFGGST